MKSPEGTKEQLVIRLVEEPDRIHPILSRGSVATQIENLIFQPLAEIDPLTLEFTPVLIDKITEAKLEQREDFGVVNRVDLRLKPDAVWPNGNRVTYHDILFTLKAVFNPEVGAGRFRTSLSFIKGEKHDENDPGFISFYLDTAAFGADRDLMNFHILPEYVYDSLQLLRSYSLSQLINESDEVDRTNLSKFAGLFSSDRMSRLDVVGSGPYQLEYWNTGYEIKLVRKKDWWGHRHAGSNHFKAIPEEIVYRVIPDDHLAITALANDNVDLISNVNPEKFKAMQATSGDQYQFFTPKIPMYFYIIMNNKSPLLEEKEVRKALAYLVDQQKMIDVVMNGYGSPLTAPLLPEGPYYDKSILPYTFDVGRANQLLENAGWQDTDGDGFRDKEIDGKRKNLQLRLNITGSEAGRNIALMFQNQAKQAGVDIEIVTTKFSNSMTDMRTGNFEMVAASARQSYLEVNLKPNWHSSGFGSGGSNMSGYSSERMDQILDDLEVESNNKRRLNLYHAFHRQIHEDVPVLFLMMPTERILASKSWHINISPRRPGYFEQLFEPVNR